MKRGDEFLLSSSVGFYDTDPKFNNPKKSHKKGKKKAAMQAAAIGTVRTTSFWK